MPWWYMASEFLHSGDCRVLAESGGLALQGQGLLLMLWVAWSQSRHDAGAAPSNLCLPFPTDVWAGGFSLAMASLRAARLLFGRMSQVMSVASVLAIG